MNLPFLKKYQPKRYNEFVIDKEYIQLLKTLINMNNLNILLMDSFFCLKSMLFLKYFKNTKEK